MFRVTEFNNSDRSKDMGQTWPLSGLSGDVALSPSVIIDTRSITLSTKAEGLNDLRAYAVKFEIQMETCSHTGDKEGVSIFLYLLTIAQLLLSAWVEIVGMISRRPIRPASTIFGAFWQGHVAMSE